MIHEYHLPRPARQSLKAKGARSSKEIQTARAHDELLHREKQWEASIEPMVQYLRRFPRNSAALRLKLAHILLVDQHRPYKALAVLSKIPAQALTPEQQTLRAKLEAEAHRQSEDADLEVQGEDW